MKNIDPQGGRDIEVTGSKGGVAAVDRAFAIIGAFTHRKPVLSLAEISRSTGLYKSTILRLLGSLEKGLFVVQRADGNYQLGPAVVELSSIYQDSFDLRQFVQPTLERLVEVTSEGASFFVRVGDEQMCLFRVDGNQTIRDYTIRLGDRRPIDKGASSQAFRRFETVQGPYTVADLVFSSFGTVTPEMAALAAPVFGQGNDLVGVVTLSGPTSRIDEQRAQTLGPQLAEQAVTLSRMLGAQSGLFRDI